MAAYGKPLKSDASGRPSLPNRSRVIQAAQTMSGAMNWRELKPPNAPLYLAATNGRLSVAVKEVSIRALN